MHISQKIIFSLFLTFICFTLSLAQPKGEDIVIGKSFSIQSDILDEERPYLIYLPEDYDETGPPVSVMYLLDGGGNFHHTTGAVRFLAKNNRIPNMMVVAIPNTSDRTRDLTPAIENDSVASEQFPTAGGADQMLAFIKDELIPHIDQTYHTAPYKILTGHSFGGLFAVHTLLTEPQLFDAYISISPSMWWDKQSLVTRAETFLDQAPELNCFFYMTMGNEGGDMLDGAQKLVALFEEADESNLSWDFKLMEEETHGSIPHRSTYYGLETIFKEWFSADYNELFASKGVEGISNHFRYVSKKMGCEMQPDEMEMNNLGYSLMQNGKVEDAIAVFLKNIELYPRSSNVYDSAGEAYMTNNQNDLAEKYYKKSMLLNPGNANGIAMLRKMGVEYDPGEMEVKLSAEEQKAFIGEYEVSAGGVLTIQLENGKMTAKHPAIPEQTMLYYSNDVFLLQPENVPMKFTMDEENNAEGFEVEMGIGVVVIGKRVEENANSVEKN